ncbi:hypothetical protein PMAYCL1PPCAC_06516, partial [Pristionchus mayeri]
SALLPKRPSSRSSSRPRSSHKTRDPDPFGQPLPSRGTIDILASKVRRTSVSSMGRNESSPVRVVSVGPVVNNGKPPHPPPIHFTPPRDAKGPATTNKDAKSASPVNAASLPQSKPVPVSYTNAPLSVSKSVPPVPVGTVLKTIPTVPIPSGELPSVAPITVPSASISAGASPSKDASSLGSGPKSVAIPVIGTAPKPAPTAPISTDPTLKQSRTPSKPVQEAPKKQSPSKTQNTSSIPPSKTRPPSLLSRSPSKPRKSSSSLSPPIDKDIPNLPADRPVKGVDPVFAVAEMMNEEIPIKEANEIRMSTRKEICANTGGAIGNTPLVMLNSIGKGLPGKIAVKLEYMNPAGSVKDRVGYAMIEDAEKRGLISPGKTVLIEPTSGNMGIALAFVARIKGYKLILTMPASMSVERRSLLKAYGAEVVLTDPATAVKGALQRAKELQAAIPNSHILNQFGNPANVQAHYATTGPEVWDQANGKVDIVCYGVGSGGTLSGVGKYLKEKKPSVEVYPVEPFESSVINGLPHSPHKIQGMGTGFIPDILDRSLFSEALRVHSNDAIAMAKRLATEEAILGGISSGANVCAAVQLATRPENEGKLIVTNINSFGERYLSTTLYSDIREAAEKLKMMSLDESLDIAQKYV